MNTDVHLLVVHAGDHRGVAISIRNWVDVFREFEIRPSLLTIDSIFARRVEMARLATEQGLHAEVGPGSLQEARREGLLDDRKWIYLGFDKPKSILESLDLAGQLRRGIVASFFIEFPGWQLAVFRAVIDADDMAARAQIRLFIERLLELTTLTGSAAIFGLGARSQNVLIEPLMRQGFLRQGFRAIAKRSLGQAPDVRPLAVDIGGAPPGAPG